MPAGSFTFRQGPWRLRVRCDQGLVRRRLEDAWSVIFAAPHRNGKVDAFAVFDGLGGEPHGDRAAQAAQDGLRQALAEGKDSRDVLIRLNKFVLPSEGATTAVIAIATRGETGIAIAHVGDSSAYALTDDTPVLVTPRDSGPHNQVTDFLGNPTLEGHETSVAVPAGSALVLCTDGVDGVVDVAAMGPVLRATPSQIDGALDRLFAEIRKRGAPDNATLVWVRRD